MASERSAVATTIPTQAKDESRLALNRTLLGVAERELRKAVMEQVRPPMGMYVRISSAEEAAIRRGVREICIEAHHLELRVEEMLVDIKQAWTQLAAERVLHLGDRDGDVLRGVVSSAIELFFEARDLQGRDVRS
jgi:hypothetical protein